MVQTTPVGFNPIEFMKRRNLISTILVGSIVSPGCVQLNTQPKQVPIRVENQTEQSLLIELRFSENGTNDVLVSTNLRLEPDEEETVYVEPIVENGDYFLSVEVENNVKETSLSGGRIREISVMIRSIDNIKISTTST